MEKVWHGERGKRVGGSGVKCSTDNEVKDKLGNDPTSGQVIPK